MRGITTDLNYPQTSAQKLIDIKGEFAAKNCHMEAPFDLHNSIYPEQTVDVNIGNRHPLLKVQTPGPN
jgi:hypothetical protein